MQVNELIVEVRNSAFQRVGLITLDNLAGFEATLRLNNVGNWSISLPAELPMAEELRQPGAGIIVTGPTGVQISGPTVSATLEKTKEDPNGIWTISGVDDSVVLADRLAYPDPSVSDPSLSATANDIRIGKASTIMCAYVDANLGVLAPTARRIPAMASSVDPVIGSTLTGSARFEVMGELLSNLASIDGLGFDVKQNGEDLVFSVFQPADRSAEVRMDIANNTLSKSEYGYASPETTRAIVGGTGVGTDRSLVEVTSTESVNAESDWGRRIERFLDQNNEENEDVLLQKGAEELAKNGKTFTSVEILPSSDLTMRYGIDWNLGDKVGVTIGNQDVSATVTTVAIRIDEDGLRVGATVGEPSGVDYEALVARKQTQTSQRLNALELKESGVGSGIPFAMAAGSVSVTATASNAGQVAVTLPAGRFTQAPIITCTIANTTAGVTQGYVARASGITATGFTAFVIRTDGASQTATMAVHWHAVQMTPTSATG